MEEQRSLKTPTMAKSTRTSDHHHYHDQDGPLPKQRKTFIALDTRQSDMDMAFQLQLGEALAASLAPAIQLPATPRLAAPPLRLAPPSPALPPPILRSEVAQNTAAKTTREWMRLYCKGLVSHDKALAGAGIAICDERDNVIFEGKKGLKDLFGDHSGETAELAALIVGLQQALEFNFKRLTFYLDNKLLYEYVMNQRLPGSSKAADLLNQVSILRRKFRHCRPLLVASHDIKFACKIAMDAINSEITSPAKAGKCRDTKVVNKVTLAERKLKYSTKCESRKETCLVCFEDTNTDQMFSIATCTHKYCLPCMKRYVELKLQSGMVPQCPHEGCKSEVSISSCKTFLAPKVVDDMRERIKECSIPVTEKVYCPYPRCFALMSKAEVLNYTRTSFVSEGGRKCMKCQYYFCINCKAPWHYNMTCDDFKRSTKYLRTDEHMLESLATKKLWRQCLKCKHMIELRSGCYHMTCRCGYQFCYTCGAEWKNKKATCSCKLWSLLNIMRRP